jgi:peptidoglycan L-alanyl-D-glutamate endopeptidase CwlK
MQRANYETKNSSSNRRIWGLDPNGVDPSIKLDIVTALNISEAYGDGSLVVAQGHRTNAEQDALYAQGRTTPGRIVTHAKGGQSVHNRGTAVDVFRVDGGTLHAPSKSTVATFKRMGFSWGGDWSPKKNDPPHFER